MNANILKEAHKLTREIKKEFPEVDYKTQLGINIKFLLEEGNNIVDITVKATQHIKPVVKAVKKCIKTIATALPKLNLTNLKVMILDKIDSNPFVMGRYHYKNKVLKVKADYLDEIEHTIYHELGHFVHKELFDLKTVRLSTQYKSDYAKTDSQENFAEAFADLFSGRFKDMEEEPKRNIQIKRALGIL